MKNFLLLLFICGCALISNPISAMDLKICALDTGFGPYTGPKGDGEWQNILASAVKNLNVNVQYQYAPRERCLLKIKRGEVDAVFAAITKDKLEYMVFPKKKNGQEDLSRVIGVVKYKIYKKKNSIVDWDGKKFINLGNQTIGAQRGLQIQDLLRDIKVNTAGDLVATPEQNLIKLNLGRIVAAAVEEAQGDRVIREYDLKDIVKLPKTFSNSYVHLAFSLSFYSKNKILAENIWDNIKLKRKVGGKRSPQGESVFKQQIVLL